MVKVEGTGKFFEDIDKWIHQVEQISEGVVRGLAIQSFNFIVENSAQYSGDFAANWNLSVGQPDYQFTDGVLTNLRGYELITRIAGDSEAVELAKGRARSVLGSIKFGSSVYITNTAGNEEDYAWKIENGTVNFRDGNQGHTVERAMDLLKTTPFITRQKALQLNETRL
jgi:hypothetical protein